jgi:FeS assembly SUF system protein
MEMTVEMTEALRQQVIGALKTVYDPEIPVDIYELGLIYDILIAPEGAVTVKMTLTSPNCPEAGSIPPAVEAKVKAIPGVTAAKAEVGWDPPWTQEMMSEAAKLQLGL